MATTPWMAQCLRVVFHWAPHWDEVVEYWEARKFGEKVFPGIRTAALVFRQDAGGLFEGKTWERHRAEGTLLCGTGGGPHDEHAFGSEDRKQGECGATLMAKFLGIENDRALSKILSYTLENDTRASHDSFMDLAAALREDHLYSRFSPEEIVFTYMNHLESFYQKQINFWKAEEEIKNARITRVNVDGRHYVIVTAITMNPEFSRFARSQFGVSASVVIQKGSPGINNMQVFFNQAAGINTVNIAGAIRWREAELAGRKIPQTAEDFAELAREGSVSFAPEWYYVWGNLLNGSHTAVGIPPTRIPLDEIRELVILALTGGRKPTSIKKLGRAA